MNNQRKAETWVTLVFGQPGREVFRAAFRNRVVVVGRVTRVFKYLGF